MNSELQITLDEVLPRLSQSLQRKLLYSVELQRNLHLLMIVRTDSISLFQAERTASVFIMLQSLLE